MATKFERKVLGFDEVGFEHEKTEIQNYCDAANEAIAELNDSYGLPLTDEEKKAIFMDLNANPNGFLDKQYPEQKSKFLRTESINDLKSFVQDTVFRFKHFDYQYRNTIQIKRGKFCIDDDLLEDVKRKFEYSLDSERAVKLHEKHLELFTGIQEIMGEISQVNYSFNWRNLFVDDLKDGQFKINQLNYNRL